MSARTGIQWTDHTHNAWWGCQKVDELCRNCYAKNIDRRGGFRHWGTRDYRILSDAYWAEPLQWNKHTIGTGLGFRVFTASMGDVVDMQARESQPQRLFDLIHQCRGLHWHMLTKRPAQARWYLAQVQGWPLTNVHLGVSCGTQQTADAYIPILLDTPAAIHWLSVEPLLESVTLSRYLSRLDWVVIGGECGFHARPTELEWLRSLIAEARAAKVPVFVKQLGSVWASGPYRNYRRIDSHGSNIDQWPAEFRIREFPETRGAWRD